MKNVIRITLILSIIVTIILFLVSGHPQDIANSKVYYCDVKNFRISTTIEVNQNNQKKCEIEGTIFEFVTDPLTMYENGKSVAYANNYSHLISQDSYQIITDNEQIEIVESVNFLNNSYDIYNQNGQQTAYAVFDKINTHGEIYDMKDNLIANSTSKFIFNDYIVQISNNSPMEEQTILMIFASYYSNTFANSNSSNDSSNDD